MANCKECDFFGENVRQGFSKAERVFLLSSTATMMKWLMANPNAQSWDKEVASSVTTKVLLSFPENDREILLGMLKQSAQVNIRMSRCGHGSGLKSV